MLLYLVVSLGSLITTTNGYFLGCSLRPCQQICVNVLVSLLGYECRCRSGYIVDPWDMRKCLLLKPACGRGFQNSVISPYNCVDVDECNLINSPCDQNCRNNQGSYECSCRSGFVVSIRDPTKCELLRSTCGRGFQSSGYPLYFCADVDECNLKNSPCDQTCRNSQGSYECSCRSGYVVNISDPTKCERPAVTSYPKAVQSNPINPARFIGVDACSTGRRCEHICTNISTGRKCSCNSGYVINDEDNTLCDEVEVCKIKADIILVFDASGSIGAEHFDKQFVFAKRLTSNFKLGPSDVRFGGIVYSRFAKKLFDLKDHNNRKTLHKALSNVTYMSSSTYTNEAFQLIDKQQLFSTNKGGRGDAPDIVVLFTDGDPTDVDKALESAQRLKDIGILVLGIAIGSELDFSMLKKITSTPDDALEATSYDTIEYIEKRLTQLLCQVSRSSH